jgi:RNA polymerase sigma factor FliA
MSTEHAEFDWQLVKQGDASERAKAIDRYLYLASAVGYKVARSLPAHIDKDDIIQLACEGLCKAVDNFKPEMNVKFETYCIPVIRGAIYDELRKQDWAPRSLRKKQRDIDHHRIAVESDLQRKATDAEIAHGLEISESDVVRVRMMTTHSVVHSLDEIAPWDDEDSHTRIAAPQGDSTPIFGMVIGELVEWLKTRNAMEQAVVALYY